MSKRARPDEEVPHLRNVEARTAAAQSPAEATKARKEAVSGVNVMLKVVKDMWSKRDAIGMLEATNGLQDSIRLYQKAWKFEISGER